MMRRNHIGWMGFVLALGMAVTGCGKAGSKSGGRSFESAAPEIKATWDNAVAADRTNGYVPAVMGYKQVLLQRDQLTPDQVKAVEDASTKLFKRLADAAHKADPAALQALATMHDIERGRRLRQ
jgi:hypothetical protein